MNIEGFDSRILLEMLNSKDIALFAYLGNISLKSSHIHV